METSRQKIAILYLLSKCGVRMSEKRLTEAASQLSLMEYFSLRTNLHDLTENGLVKREDSVNGRFYSLTKVGLGTLDFFKKDLYASMREDIDAYAEKNAPDIQLESRVFAEYIRLSDDQYRVVLRIIENDLFVFEMTFFAASRGEADKYVTAWRKKALEVYRQVFEALLA